MHSLYSSPQKTKSSPTASKTQRQPRKSARRLFALLLALIVFSLLPFAGLPAQETTLPAENPTTQASPQDKPGAKDEKTKEDASEKIAQKSPGLEKQNEGIWSLIMRGGWTMLGLGFISTIILAFSLERLLYFRARGLATKGFQARLETLLREGGLEKAASEIQPNAGLLPSIIHYGLLHRNEGADGMEHAIERRATVEIGKLERGLNLLANFGNLAPLLGFFGTVVGMRASFLQFVIQKAPTAQDLAGGVEEALITTAAGLLIAIPAYLIYNLFIYKIDNLSMEVEDAAAKLRDAFLQNPSPVKKQGAFRRKKAAKKTAKRIEDK